uniref:Cyclin N-terminal domain-containing protein n=1 Tax=Heterorhabditis bacteriophora TaxID=37862 RepID=A0A1I7WT72_HETBA
MSDSKRALKADRERCYTGYQSFGAAFRTQKFSLTLRERREGNITNLEKRSSLQILNESFNNGSGYTSLGKSSLLLRRVPGSTKYKELLKLDKPEPFPKYFAPLSESSSPDSVDFSHISPDNRFLSSLRASHLFSLGYAFIRSRLHSLSPAAVFEAAILVADASLLKNGEADEASIVALLQQRASSIKLPPSMALGIKTVLDCICNAKNVVSNYEATCYNGVIFHEPVHYYLACAALDSNNWAKFE